MIVGEKKIGSLLKVMAKDGGLDENKRFTNHSTRKHLVQKLRDSGIAPTDIMQISGHRNIQSVTNYSTMSEEKHKKCSNLLSNTRLSSSAIAETSTIVSQEKYKYEQPFPPQMCSLILHTHCKETLKVFILPQHQQSQQIKVKSVYTTPVHLILT